MANMTTIHTHTQHLAQTHHAAGSAHIAVQSHQHQAGQGQTHHHHHHVLHHHFHHFLAPTILHIPGQAPLLVIDQWVPTPTGFAYTGPPVAVWPLQTHPNQPNANAGQQQQPQQGAAPLQLVDSGPTPPPTP